MVYRNTSMEVNIIGWKISIVQSNLHIKIVDVCCSKIFSTRGPGIKKFSIPLVIERKFCYIHSFVCPSYIESNGKQAGAAQHLVICRRTVYLGGSKVAASCHISQYNTSQAYPARFKPV